MQEIENGSLQAVLPTNLPDPKSFYVVNHLDRLDDQKIQAFRNGLLTQLNEKKMNKLALYCRPGFEKEVAAEIHRIKQVI
ncbi:DNA-binding transcriptional dual regulator [Haemophilus influenzae]|uniref:DNA-binding transcriptional dual regulator n=1 Tax=Haemophilus influenzae TaxID=727 RepID=A0A2X1RUJ5_HAEIF|nr:DNA-binding transcriptional dual regulator [Haemophilus influenzae]